MKEVPGQNIKMSEPAVIGQLTVVVIDASVRRMVAFCLQRIGIAIVEVKNCRQPYDIVIENFNLIDLAIVDFDMPVMRGDEFIHQVRQLPDAEHLPLLSLSGSG
jgi:two-component system cell cycle response regulator